MVEMIEVTSSNIESVGYDNDEQTLFVKFKSGTTYSYSEVPVEIYDEMLQADSKGKYFYANIKSVYAYNKLD